MTFTTSIIQYRPTPHGPGTPNAFPRLDLPLTVSGRYTGPVPSFRPLSNGRGGEDRPATASSAASSLKSADAPAAVPLNYNALRGGGGPRPLSSGSNSSGGSSRTPLGRFRRDEQAHEKLALKLSGDSAGAGATASAISSAITTAAAAAPPPPPPMMIMMPMDPSSLPGEGLILPSDPRPAEHDRGSGGGGAGPSTMPMPYRRHDIPLPPSAPALPRTVLGGHGCSRAAAARTAAEDLRERQQFMKAPEWDMLASDVQAKYAHEV